MAMEVFRELCKKLDDRLDQDVRSDDPEQAKLDSLLHRTQTERAFLLSETISMRRPWEAGPGVALNNAGKMVVSDWYAIGDYHGAVKQSRLRRIEPKQEALSKQDSKLIIDCALYDLETGDIFSKYNAYEFLSTGLLTQPNNLEFEIIPIDSTRWKEVDRILLRIESQDKNDRLSAQVVARTAIVNSLARGQ